MNIKGNANSPNMESMRTPQEYTYRLIYRIKSTERSFRVLPAASMRLQISEYISVIEPTEHRTGLFLITLTPVRNRKFRQYFPTPDRNACFVIQQKKQFIFQSQGLKTADDGVSLNLRLIEQRLSSSLVTDTQGA